MYSSEKLATFDVYLYTISFGAIWLILSLETRRKVKWHIYLVRRIFRIIHREQSQKDREKCARVAANKKESVRCAIRRISKGSIESSKRE